LPENSEVAVTIRYDEEAKVHVAARDQTSGRRAEAEIVRAENLKPQLTTDQKSGIDATLITNSPQPTETPVQSPRSADAATARRPARSSESAPRPYVVGRAAVPRPRTEAKTAQDPEDSGEVEFWRSLH